MNDIVKNSSALALVAQEEIETLRNAKDRKIKIGRSFVRLKEVHVGGVHATLARLALRKWGPNLNEAIDSLLNSACRMTAIEAFRQLFSADAFDKANIDGSFLTNFPLLVRTYDHYVHFVVASRFKAEQENKGKFKRDAERKNIQKNRERVSFDYHIGEKSTESLHFFYLFSLANLEHYLLVIIVTLAATLNFWRKLVLIVTMNTMKTLAFML